jgi:hypothetical protein
MNEEAVMTKFRIVSRHLPGETEENHETLRIAGLRAEI